jgi:hypothetical protein
MSSLNTNVFNQLLSVVEEKTEGQLTNEKLKLMHMAISFKIHDLDSANEIRTLLEHLKKLENAASQDSRLSLNCKICKPQVLKEIRDLLLLKALTCLKYSCTNMDMKEKCEVMKILVSDDDYGKIDNYRMQWPENLGITIDELVEPIICLNEVTKTTEKSHLATQTRAIREEILPRIYFASCFIEDNYRVKKLFDSRNWNYGIGQYIVELKTILQPS